MRTGTIREVRDRCAEAGLIATRPGFVGPTDFGLDALVALLGVFALTLRDDDLTEICQALASLAQGLEL